MNSVKEIKAWLDAHEVSNYIINNDLSVTVNGNVNLNGILAEKVLPVKFKDVVGYFDISNNSLISLEGSPHSVTRDFNCSNNQLESLFDAPYKVFDFDCSNNMLKNLSYCPKEIQGFFNCSNNNLDSLLGVPRTIKDYFDCSNNNITSLKGGPQIIEKYFNCSKNSLTNLNGGPVNVAEDYICYGNALTDLDEIADNIGFNFMTDMRFNHLKKVHNDDKDYFTYKGSDVIEHVRKPIVDLTHKEDIIKWLNKNRIKNFEFNQDGEINVKGGVNLAGKLENFSKLPVVFNKIEGTFDISDNELTSLDGCPKYVAKDFICLKNEIKSLKGCPKEVHGNFIIIHNNIQSLKHSPNYVKGDFICSHNPITNLDGINTVDGDVFTNVLIDSVKSQKYVYKNVATYKYSGESIMNFLDKDYVNLTPEEIKYFQTRTNLKNAIENMINTNQLNKENITETLIRNLIKYSLHELKAKVLDIKNPKKYQKEVLSEEDIAKAAFNIEL